MEVHRFDGDGTAALGPLRRRHDQRPPNEAARSIDRPGRRRVRGPDKQLCDTEPMSELIIFTSSEFSDAEVLSLYESVGWSAYIRDPDGSSERSEVPHGKRQ